MFGKKTFSDSVFNTIKIAELLGSGVDTTTISRTLHVDPEKVERMNKRYRDGLYEKLDKKWFDEYPDEIPPDYLKRRERTKPKKLNSKRNSTNKCKCKKITPF
jgi:hypothetical protein